MPGPGIQLNERAQTILRLLIDHYVRDGQPVGSRVLSRDSSLSLSPATIRNVMYDLEEMGLLVSPHTSAGRIPTELGYRVFVDSLIQIQELHNADLERLRSNMQPGTDTRDLIGHVSRMLSDMTHMAGLVTVPRMDNPQLRHIEFLPLSDQRVLTILVVNEKEVQNLIIHTNRQYDAEELRRITNFINATYGGRGVREIRDLLRDELERTRQAMHDGMAEAIEIAGQVFDDESLGGAEDENLVVAGQTNLMTFAELSSVDRLKNLFEAFNHKRDMFHLLERCVETDGIKIFIGHESGYEALDSCSLVTAPYVHEGQVAGVLGVIGPTRMAYERVIPIVDITSKLLSAALNNQN